MSPDRDENTDEEFLVANAPGADSASGADAGGGPGRHAGDEAAPDAEPLTEAEFLAHPEPAEAGGSAQASVEQDLNDLVADARNQRDEYLDLAQRTKADFDNYRKRMAVEATAAKVRGKLDVAADLIEAADNLERVLAATEVALDEALNAELPADAPIAVQGVIVAYRDVNKVLKRAGVEVYDPSGEAFDPVFHEALQALPAEGTEPGIILEVMQRGYRSGETVIRPARVVVSQ